MNKEEVMELVTWMRDQGVGHFKTNDLEVSFFPNMARLAPMEEPEKPEVDPKENPLGAPYGVTDKTLLRSAV